MHASTSVRENVIILDEIIRVDLTRLAVATEKNQTDLHNLPDTDSSHFPSLDVKALMMVGGAYFTTESRREECQDGSSWLLSCIWNGGDHIASPGREGFLSIKRQDPNQPSPGDPERTPPPNHDPWFG